MKKSPTVILAILLVLCICFAALLGVRLKDANAKLTDVTDERDQLNAATKTLTTEKEQDANAAAERDRKLRMYRRAETSRAEMLALQRAEIARWPEYDETVTLKTWPGKSMHLFFPRYYTLQDEQGSVLVRASALWALMDRQSRSMIFPEEAGIEIPGAELAEACALPRAVKPISATDETRFTVPYSYADLNGHMNNTRYLDLAQDVLPAALRQRPITRLEIEHSAEARVDQTLTLRFGGEGDDWFVQGEGEKRIFRLRLRYG